MKNIYINSLELGYNNSSNGISFNDIVKQLDINLSNDRFKLNYTIWFYSNFYNEFIEKYVIGSNNFPNSNNRISTATIENISKHNNEISFIKGDSVNKYIDYVELRDARVSSRKAIRIAYTSIIIALLSIVAQIISAHYFPPTILIEKSDNRNGTTKCEFQDSTCCKLREHEMYNSERKITNKLNKNQQINDSTNNSK